MSQTGWANRVSGASGTGLRGRRASKRWREAARGSRGDPAGRGRWPGRRVCCITTVKGGLGSLPLATRSSYFRLRSGLRRIAVSAGMWSRRRTFSRPPWMKLRPFPVPDSRVTGASPAKLAAWGPVMVLSSGMWMSSPAALAAAIPGIDVRASALRARSSSLRSSLSISAPTRSSCRTICSSRRRLTCLARG